MPFNIIRSSIENLEQKPNSNGAAIIRFSSSGRDFQSATPMDPQNYDQPWDLIRFLATAQKLKIDFLAITWQPALSEVGAGGTAEIRQSLINLQMSFAFKAIKDAKWVDKINEAERPRKMRTRFQALIAEISVLGHHSVREHPNIISLFGICWDILPSGRVWPVLVFKKAPLGDLYRFTRSEKGKAMTIDTRLKLCADVATAVRDLHGSYIIHGDIKPENILIFEDDSDIYVAKVADFGYSTIFTGAGGITMPRSEPWVAPEWEDGRGCTFSDAQKMDIYSFGMLCLWLLLDVSLDDLVIKREHEEDMVAFANERAESHDILQHLLRANLSMIFSLTLSSDMNNRSQDLNQVMSYLTCYTQRRHDLHPPKNIIIDMNVPLLFSIVPSAWQLYEADIRVRTYIPKALEEHMDTIFDEKVAQNCAFQLALCSKLGFGAFESHGYMTYLSKSHRDVSELGKEIEKLRVPYAGYQNRAVSTLISKGYLSLLSLQEQSSNREDQEEIISKCRKEISDLEHETPENHDLILSLKSALASALLLRGHWEDAEAIQRTVLERFQRLKVSDSPLILTSMANLASMCRIQGRFTEAEKLEVQVMETRKRVLGMEHPDTLISMANLASTFWNQGRLKDTEKLQVEVMKMSRSILGEEHPSTLTSMTNLASTFWYQQRLSEAEELQVQVMKMSSKVLGTDHPSTLTTMTNLASTFWKQKRWNEAEKVQVQIIEARKRILGVEHPDTLATMSNLALTFAKQGRLKKAEELQVQVMKMRKTLLRVEHPDTLTSMSNLAYTFQKQDRWKESQELQVQITKMRLEVLGVEHPDTLNSMDDLARTYKLRGQDDDAIDMMKDLVKHLTRKMGANHRATLNSIKSLEQWTNP